MQQPDERSKALDALHAALQRVFELGVAELGDEAKGALAQGLEGVDSRVVFRVATGPFTLVCCLEGAGSTVELFRIDTHRLSGARH